MNAMQDLRQDSTTLGSIVRGAATAALLAGGLLPASLRAAVERDGDDRASAASAQAALPASPEAPQAVPHPFERSFNTILRTLENFGIRPEPATATEMKSKAGTAVAKLESPDPNVQREGEKELREIKDFMKKIVVDKLSYGDEETARSIGEHVERYFENQLESHAAGLAGARLGNALFDLGSKAQAPRDGTEESRQQAQAVQPPAGRAKEAIAEARQQLLRRETTLPRVAGDPAREQVRARLLAMTQKLEAADENHDNQISDEEYRRSVQAAVDVAKSVR